jgi:hypothetical protein
MSLIKCPECGHDVSDQASTCIKCGHPIKTATQQKSPLNNAWGAVTKSRTPINVFALAMMACAAVLGASATQIDNPCNLTAFTYTLHIFLALSGMFFATILFCRKGIYHPDDLAKAKQTGVDDLGQDRPIVAAVLICLMVAGYSTYQVISIHVLKEEKTLLTECTTVLKSASTDKHDPASQ